MSLLDKSSIVLPRGAASKAGDIAAWNPQTQEIVSLGITQATPNLTIVNEDGLIESVGENILPRDFRNGGCGEFIFWPQRTNFMLQSEDIAGWSPISGVTTTANTQVAPDGENTADTIEGNGTSTGCRLNKSVSVSSAGVHIFSCFLKKGTNNFAVIDISGFVGGSGTGTSFFDLANGTTPTSGAKMTSYDDDWYFCQSAPYTVDGGDTGGNMSIYISLTDTVRDFPTAAAANGKSIYAWGAQVEMGDFATAYIKTTASSETREQIQLSESGLSNLIGQSEGGLYFEYKPFVTDEDSFIALSDGTFNNRVVLGINGGTARYRYIVVSGGVTSADLSPPSPTPSVDSYSKYGIRYSEDDFALYVDGSSIAVDDSGSTFSGSTLDVLSFNNGAGGAILEGSIIGLSVFNSNPTNTQLSEITT